MRLLDKNWPFHAAVMALFVVVMCGWRYLMVGFDVDFGFGFAMGAIAGVLLTILAVGWQRGEMRGTGPQEVLSSLPKEAQVIDGVVLRPIKTE